MPYTLTRQVEKEAEGRERVEQASARVAQSKGMLVALYHLKRLHDAHGARVAVLCEEEVR